MNVTPAPTHRSTVTSIVAASLTPFPSVTAAAISPMTLTSPASPTETNVIAPNPTPLPTSTATTIPPSTSVTPVAAACEAASSRSRLQTGTSATIPRRLNFRSSPGIYDNWLLTNLPGTKVEVVGGPECFPHFTGAYVWWQIKLPNGQIGWSAESSQHGAFYFMEPMP